MTILSNPKIILSILEIIRCKLKINLSKRSNIRCENF